MHAPPWPATSCGGRGNATGGCTLCDAGVAGDHVVRLTAGPAPLTSVQFGE
jgi:hypothetical protein